MQKGSVSLPLLLTVLLVIVFLLVAQYSSTPNEGFTDSVAVLAMITAVAIGIERVLEAGWTIIELTHNTWWPFNLVGDEIEKLLGKLDEQLKPVYNQATEAINEMVALAKLSQAEATTAEREIQDIKDRIMKLKALAPSNQQINLIAASAFQGISYLERKYPSFITAANSATQAATGLADFVATFKDNPGKRLISIYVGAMLGLIIAGLVGLDVFQAVAGDISVTTEGSRLFPFIGVALTGLLMGLGSNPTHEVIRALQEIKKSHETRNAPAPNVPVTPETGIAGFSEADIARIAGIARRPASDFSEADIAPASDFSEVGIARELAPRPVSTFSLRRPD
jgi:hypothetical protein